MPSSTESIPGESELVRSLKRLLSVRTLPMTVVSCGRYWFLAHLRVSGPRSLVRDTEPLWKTHQRTLRTAPKRATKQKV